MEVLVIFFFMLSLLKYLSTKKMLIMLMSLEMCSIFLYVMLMNLSLSGGGLFLSLYSLFLVLVVCEGVLILINMINIYRGGSLMVKSMSVLKF